MAETSLDIPDRSVQENKGAVMIIWFESPINTSEDIEKTKEKLRTISDFTDFHDNIDALNNHIQSTNRRNIFLIISDTAASELLSPAIHNLRQLDSIFIFPQYREDNQDLFGKFSKIVDIFASCDELIKSITETINDLHNQIEMFSFYGQHQQALLDLSEQSAKFLW
jgi:hypothetical protein